MPATSVPTRQRLIKTAMKLFHTQGYATTGISQILQETEVKSGSLYYFFASKQKLLEAVLDDYKQLLYPAIIQPVLEQVSEPIERVFGVLQLYRELLVQSNCKSGCPIGNLALEVADADPSARRKIAENFEGWRLAIRHLLDDAADRLPSDVDRDRLATFILTTMEGGVMQARAYESLEPFDASVAMLRDYFDRLLASANLQTQTEGEPS